MGLSVAQATCSAHGGSISAVSDRRSVMTITVSLPV
ncbi:hypothetical protein ACIPZF_01370 [Pseudomonas sp. NPDC089752]